MKLWSNIARGTAVFLILASYGTMIWFGLTEEQRRALDIQEKPPTADFVQLNITVTSIDTAKKLLTERIRIIPMGRFAIDTNTPASNLKLLLNSVSGQQAILLPKGTRIAPIDATTILAGNPNRYPFDIYSTYIDLLLTTPAARSVDSLNGPEIGQVDDAVGGGPLIIGTSDLNHNETIPISEHISASIPQYKFSGVVSRDGTHKLTHTHIFVRRANNVLAVSVGVMAMMILLAMSIGGMVLRVTASPGEINLLPLSLCIALIFGLPALRNMQPDVPGAGVLGDYISFMWAEFTVSLSAVALAWTWIVRSKKQDQGKLPAKPGSLRD